MEHRSVVSESVLLRQLLLASGAMGARLFRNQTGHYILAQPSCRNCQAHGRHLSSGLAVGSPDLVGWMPILVGPEHLGRTLAVFVGVEAKTDTGRVSEAQRRFLTALERDGALVGVARSVADLDALLGVARPSDTTDCGLLRDEDRRKMPRLLP